MSRLKVFISVLIVMALITLSGAAVWAAPGRQDPSPEPTEEPTAEPTEEPAVEPTEVPDSDPDEGEESTVHPVASALAEFFADILGLSYDEIMGYHKSGAGFGTIAQACWMSSLLEGEVTTSDILAAKQNHDFSSIELPDGGTAKNWGQFKKAVLSSDKARKNLGAIMSGRPDKGKVGGKPDKPPGKEKTKGGGKGKNKE